MIIGDPTAVSVYWKLAVLAPAGIVIVGVGEKVPLADVVARLTVRGEAATIGLPEASSKATVIVPELTPAVKVCGAVTKPNCVAVLAALTVTFATSAIAEIVDGNPLHSRRVEGCIERPDAGRQRGVV